MTFEYYVSSLIYNITSAKFELYDDQGNLVGSNLTATSSNYSYCNASSCYLTINYYAVSGDNLKARYYVNLGNQTNNTFVLLESDAYWRFITINTNTSQQAWNKAILHFQAWMQAWGSQQTNCIIYSTQSDCLGNIYCKWVNNATLNPMTGNYSSICVLKDNYNKGEFNRILIIFFGMVIVLFIIGKGIGFELTNPGSFVMFMSIAILILSIGGLFTFAGLTPWDFFNQYIYAYICLCISGGYNLAIIRRYSM